MVTELTARYCKDSWAGFKLDNCDALSNLTTTVWTSAQTDLSSLYIATAGLLPKTELMWSYLGYSAALHSFLCIEKRRHLSGFSQKIVCAQETSGSGPSVNGTKIIYFQEKISVWRQQDQLSGEALFNVSVSPEHACSYRRGKNKGEERWGEVTPSDRTLLPLDNGLAEVCIVY